jgi:Condensation domain
MTQPKSAQHAYDEFPCTPVQERFFVAELLSPGNAALNIALRWSLVGPVSGAMVGFALRQLVARHEILRTAFVEGENGPVQRVYPTADLHVSELDLRLLGTVEREFDRISAEEARRPFDLSRPPLMRAQLLRLSEQELPPHHGPPHRRRRLVDGHPRP